VTIAAGQATSPAFNINAVDDTVVDSSQTVTITAAVSGYVSGTDTADVLDDDVAPELLDVMVNLGNTDRSSVDQLTLDFSGIVNFGPNAFSVVQRSDASGATGTGVDTSFSSQIISGNTRVSISFDSLTRNAIGSLVLVDGNYQLTVDANEVTSVSGITMDTDFIFGDSVH